jgi:hypothetical protein
MRQIAIKLLDNEKITDAILLEDKGKIALGYLKDGKVIITQNPETIRLLLNEKNVQILQKIINDKDFAILKRIYDFISKNQFEGIETDKLKNLKFIKEIKINENLTKKYMKLKNNSKFEYADINEKIENNDYDEKFKVDNNSKLEKALADIFSIEGKIAFLIGVTGTGKTYSVENFAKLNGFKLFKTVISGSGDAREAIYGTKTLENDENGQKIVNNPGAGIEAFRNVCFKKEPTILFLDEVQRGTATDVLTIFSQTRDSDSKKEFFLVEGIDTFYPVIIKNINNEECLVLLTQESRLEHVDEKGKILKALPKKASRSEIETAMINGNVSIVNKEFLEKNGYEIVEKHSKIKEKLKLPINLFKIALSANIGYEYDMSSKLDSAVLSRCGIVDATLTDKTPVELLNLIKKENNEPSIIQYRNLTEEEHRIKEDFIINFFNAVQSGIALEETELPKRSYTPRNVKTLYSINKIPENEEIIDYLSKLINEYFILHYTNYEINEENLQPQQAQETYIKETLNNIKEIMSQNLNKTKKVKL